MDVLRKLHNTFENRKNRGALTDFEESQEEREREKKEDEEEEEDDSFIDDGYERPEAES